MPTLNFKTTLAEMTEMTSWNDHTGAYILGATLLGNEELKNKLVEFDIKADQSPDGLDHDMYQYRHTLYRELMSYAQSVLPEDQYKLFYQTT